MSHLLSRNDFAAAIRRGLGRAWMHAARHGLHDVSEAVHDAWIHDRCYDPQCEESRAPWLFEMARETPLYPDLRKEILARLRDASDEWFSDETWDLLQRARLAKEMAQRGDDEAGTALEELALAKARRPCSDDWLGAAEFVAVSGIEGLVALASIYGSRLIVDPEDSVPDEFDLMSDDEGPERTQWQKLRRELFRRATGAPELEAYCEYLEKNRREDRRSPDTARRDVPVRPRNLSSLSQILDDAQNRRGDHPGYYSAFGRFATTEELEDVFRNLLAANEDAVRIRLLWILGAGRLPSVDERLIRWAARGADDLQRASIAALATTADGRIHALARTKLEARPVAGPNLDTMALFVRNYETEDAPHIAEAIVSLEAEAHEIHDLASDLLDVYDHHRDEALLPVLRWVYEQTPCSQCRFRAVEHLAAAGSLNERMREECLHDAHPDIRRIASESRRQTR